MCLTGRQGRWRGGRLVAGRFSRWLTLVLRGAAMCGLQRLQPHAAAGLLVEGDPRLMELRVNGTLTNPSPPQPKHHREISTFTV